MEKFTENLKNNYPKTWKKFIDYLRDNYEFWSKETNENTLWFCERDPQAQIGYFFEYFDKHNIKNLIFKEEYIININTFSNISIEGIKLMFKELEKLEENGKTN